MADRTCQPDPQLAEQLLQLPSTMRFLDPLELLLGGGGGGDGAGVETIIGGGGIGGLRMEGDKAEVLGSEGGRNG